jgi:hypothetical protein
MKMARKRWIYEILKNLKELGVSNGSSTILNLY